MAKVKIQFCVNNEICDEVSNLDRLKERYPDADIEPAECLNYCASCEKHPYVLVNGEMVSGRNIKKLFQYLDKRLR
ncbi:MAG: DUF1450 domain-containing protein [Bacillaceae bacterium]|nr:DUF1450 domain-containing protein [Bacillaceae bacterium]